MLFQKATHIALLHAPYLVPAQVVEFRYTAERHLNLTAEPTDLVLVALCESGGTGHLPILELKVYVGWTGIEVTDHMGASISETGYGLSKAGANRFFGDVPGDNVALGIMRMGLQRSSWVKSCKAV